ncbi:type I-E CRISPR-associated protein Cas5/CasD [Chromohalobacter israelensis]|uniref:CRISPR-associated protein, Cas5e family n=1 Tax=Chromohalobacter israelensis (strain ATCC BAA-138 / DSM 3043 / CIP 106854 / NCIMB 13768 / 1H11) TaxID=290398 RepID=Q1R114_CHRI1|nr:type I-E CRISPR-associated protein Cas5/CasD [Chromohalobacter salexigens]ABE57594.1 CRISPR-associated protein, Cas5e family [Chromohalobacter salexigens DSM 3043]
MTGHLVFRLYAPMASWGEAAVGEARPTATYPGRGAILGLIGAALGIRRDDDEGQLRLRQSLGIAVKQRSPGWLLRDYHTVQVPPSQSKVNYRSRREELSVPKDALNTILSSRDYRCDGLWVVALRLMPDAVWTLDELKSALERPRFTLYLGRKACPLAAPLTPAIVEADHWRGALDHGFDSATDPERTWLPLIGNEAQDLRLLRLPGQVLYAWEGEADALDGNADMAESSETWDEPLHRRRWQFGARLEHRRIESVEGQS